jgi:indolepyruvate ferredoxin oxidoreductase
MKAIELNGVAVHAAKQAFHWGRVMAANPEVISARIGSAGVVVLLGLGEIIAHRANLLKEYQDSALADRYRKRVESFRQTEANLLSGRDVLTVAVAKYYYKVLAIKDEYEVARLLSAPSFLESIQRNFEGNFKVHFHLAPPAFASRDPATRILKKRNFGPWLRHALKLMAHGRKFRNTFLDPFRRTPERLAELEWIQSYEEILDLVQEGLNSRNLELCQELLTLPEQVRGYGHVRHAAVSKAKVIAQDLTSKIAELKLTNKNSTNVF